ncbi:hypothetical protein SAMN04487981_12687 [Streptomyces sp. cf386]|uniref:hypothetical protein n=1 Tax=Streptomyces sp. cf386 TaxID=1761904 RepID=UPI000888A936|nr:hypothetical protein [Streptomyces sp. cf386]SDP55717.1 hypothetical protein SAMN04487981_12687 [Streptomyces sp. cf386]
MFRKRVALVVVAGMLGLAGCTAEEGTGVAGPTDAVVTASTAVSPSASPSSSPSPASPSSSPGPTPVPVTGPDQVLVSMVVTGGFAGVHKEVTLRGDRTAHATGKGERSVHRVDATEFTEVRTLLGDPALDDVSDFTKNMQAADLFQYTLRFDGRTVMTDRSVDEPALDRLIDALSEWLPER